MSQLQLTDKKNGFASTYFVDVILPLPIPKLFTYRSPREFEGQLIVGGRIVVPFGKTKILTGIISSIHNSPPREYEAKYIMDILDEQPTMNELQLGFYTWLSEYYMCTRGEVLQAALPAGLKINTTSLVQRNPYFVDEEHVLSIEEQLVMQQLSEDTPIESALLADLLGQKNLSKVLKALTSKEAILIIDSVREKFTPKIQKFLRLNDSLVASEALLEEQFAMLEKKPKQLDVLMAYLREVPVLENPETNEDGISKEKIIELGCSPSSIKTLADKNIIELFDKEISRISSPRVHSRNIELSDIQIKSKIEILEAFETFSNVLLHGITGSGKTEIYIDLIQETLEAGHQVLYLLPEIALTSQIVSRLSVVFGDQMGVYHSKYSANERVEVWKQLQAGKINLVIGVRSSVFLPFSDLGLVIIDEEHESSFKQYDPAPRYNARDAALMLSAMHKAKTLLGSATPSLESFYQCQEKRYGYVKLDKRFGGAKLPVISTIDLARAKKTKTIRGNFANEMIDAIRQTLAQEEQVIIFQNRRGYAPFMSCDSCGWVKQCIHCDVSLTYHQYNNELRCHYCGYKTPPPNECAACGSHKLSTVSFGTEQLEEELNLYFPDTEVKRLDLDTTRGKNSHHNILQDFDTGKTGILVGTQMVAKGLDFNNVGLVGIIDIDRMLRFPDFRSIERTFQLAVQVAGRAGRSHKIGKVLIQTFNPSQPIIDAILQQDFPDFYGVEIEERRLFNYPPFTRVIRLTIRDRDHQMASEAAKEIHQHLTNNLGTAMILGPVTPLISKIRDRYLRELYLKIGRKKDIAAIKALIQESINKVIIKKEFKQTGIVIDVDPI